LARVLGEDGLLVGGLAVGAHGYVRATRDVDFVARTPLSELRKRLDDQGIPAILTRGDVLEGDFPCLRGTLGGVRFDILPPLVPLVWDRAITLSMGKGTTLRVVDLEGLLRLKFRAGGPRDLMDAAALVLIHPQQQRPARELATAYRVAEWFETWLADPRLRTEVAESAASERARAKTARPKKKPHRPGVRGRGRR
jgi:hypothetical protein